MRRRGPDAHHHHHHPLPSPPVPTSPLAGGYRSGMNPEAMNVLRCAQKKATSLGEIHILLLSVANVVFFLILTSCFYFNGTGSPKKGNFHRCQFLFFWPVSPHLSSTACMLRLMRAVSGSHQRKAGPSPAPPATLTPLRALLAWTRMYFRSNYAERGKKKKKENLMQLILFHTFSSCQRVPLQLEPQETTLNFANSELWNLIACLRVLVSGRDRTKAASARLMFLKQTSWIHTRSHI